MSHCHLLVPSDLFPPEHVVFTIPVEGYLQELSLSWDVSSWNGEKLVSETIKTGQDTTEFTVEVALPPGGSEGVFLSATPTVVNSGVVLRPMGGWVFPPDAEGFAVISDGVLVSKILTLAESGVTVACINVERIHEEIVDVLAGGYRVIDPDRLEEGLRSGAFRSYHIRGLDEEVIAIRELLPSGVRPDLQRWGWYTDDQNDPRCEAVIADDYIVWAIPVGLGDVRSLWRYEPGVPISNETVQRLMVHRSPEGHSGYHVYPVSTSRRNSRAYPGPR